MSQILLFVLSVVGLAAQDLIVVSLQRGTQTTTFKLDAVAAQQAFLALDFYGQSQSPKLDATRSLQDLLIALIMSQLSITPGSEIKSKTDALSAAQTALDKAKEDFRKAAGIPIAGIKPKPLSVTLAALDNRYNLTIP